MKNLTPRKALIVFAILLAVGVLIALAGVLWNDTAARLTGFLVMLAAGIFEAITYKYPHCEKYLGRTSVKGVCPHCGRKIE